MKKSKLDIQREEMDQKFQTIKWNHHPCGRGSVFEYTLNTRTMLEKTVKQYNIKTISDAGAGDLSWIRTIDWDVEYTPYDIRKWHPDVTKFDITKDVLPKTDLIFCRQVLNHLNPELQKEAVDRFYESGSKYLILTYTKLNCYGRVWEEPLELLMEDGSPGARIWKYGLWQING